MGIDHDTRWICNFWYLPFSFVLVCLLFLLSHRWLDFFVIQTKLYGVSCHDFKKFLKWYQQDDWVLSKEAEVGLGVFNRYRQSYRQTSSHKHSLKWYHSCILGIKKWHFAPLLCLLQNITVLINYKKSSCQNTFSYW